MGWFAWLGLLGGVAVIAAGCGGDDQAPRKADAAPPEASSVVVSSAELLDGLHRRVAEGRGISDATWTRDVQEVALALWPDDTEGEALAARRDHTNLAHIAGDMAGQLAQGGAEARARWLEQDESSVEIHDAFLTAASQGVEAYRAWIAEDGRALLKRRQAAILEGTAPR